MSLAERHVTGFRPSELSSSGSPPELDGLALSARLALSHVRAGSFGPAYLSCEDCGAQAIQSGPRCEHCERELGGEAGR
jgi:hypothetical protein